MLNLGSKTSPSSPIFSSPSNFQNHRWGTETGAFPWPSCCCFCKKWSNYSISSYCFKHKSMKSLSFKKVSDGQSDIQITIKYVFFFYKLLLEVKKLDVRPWNQSLHWCFLKVSIRHVLPAPWLSIQFSELFNRNLSIVYPILSFNFVIAPTATSRKNN